jgi:hypothetical protein
MRDDLGAAFTPAPAWNHAREEIAGFLAGLELVEPGLVAARGWRGGMPDASLSPRGAAYVLGTVARKRVGSGSAWR